MDKNKRQLDLRDLFRPKVQAKAQDNKAEITGNGSDEKAQDKPESSKANSVVRQPKRSGTKNKSVEVDFNYKKLNMILAGE